jgi:hypothetical protein
MDQIKYEQFLLQCISELYILFPVSIQNVKIFVSVMLLSSPKGIIISRGEYFDLRLEFCMEKSVFHVDLLCSV